MEQNIKICLVLVTYNRLEVLKKTLGHIDALTYKPEKIIIVDNNSTDDTRNFLRRYNGNQQIEILLLDSNQGYGAGLNRGIIYGETLGNYDYYWMMDDDSLPTPDSLEKMLDVLVSNNYDLLGTKGYNIRMGQPRQLGKSVEVQNADIVLIDGALVKKKVIEKVGPPSDIFFMMCEDYEFCKRVKRNKFSIGCFSLASSERLHLGGGNKFSQNTAWRGYYHSRNHMLILRKYFDLESFAGYILRQSKYLVAAIKAPDRGIRIKLRTLGIIHGLLNKKGKTLDPASMKFIKQ